jgi:hypothetical protein
VRHQIKVGIAQNMGRDNNVQGTGNACRMGETERQFTEGAVRLNYEFQAAAAGMATPLGGGQLPRGTGGSSGGGKLPTGGVPPSAPKGTDIALGLGPKSSLEKFAEQTDSVWFEGWKKSNLTKYDPTVNAVFDKAFEEAAKNARKIYFNMDRFSVKNAVSDSVDWHLNNFTNMEFKCIFQNEEILRKTTFYRDGKVWFNGSDVLNGVPIPK